MELREFAEIILYGKNLVQDKLLHPKELTDFHPGSEIISPHYPGRPKELDFSHSQSKQKVLFPNQNELEKETQRGIVLHFFANHELLAMELMALTLLRFPSAPKNFRMGVARTIIEEQKHMKLYMNRMSDFKVSFGEIPVNDFFWKCLSNMNSPLDYVTKLSMTFEQANLDFSYFYMNLMNKIGDTKTADILKLVYEEEIGHVKHGVSWFEKWRDPNLSQWESYVQHLRLPLTPARAKGLNFVREAREAAGLNNEFVDELFVFSSSKGRPPDIFSFNPCCELEVAHGRVGYRPVKFIQQLQKDCASLCLFLANQDDIVLVQQKPSLEFLSELKRCGFTLPEWYEYKNQIIDINYFKQNILGTLKPWGWSPESAEFLKNLIPFTQSKEILIYEQEKYEQFYSKSFAAEITHLIYKEFIDYKDILPLPNTLPQVCFSLEMILENIEKFLQNYELVVLKSPFGSAGQNMKRVNSNILNDNELNWINHRLKDHHSIIVEPWFDRELDFSTQLKIEKNQLNYIGQTRCLNDNRGQYLGTYLGKKGDFLSPDQIQFIYSLYGTEKINFSKFFKKISLYIGQKLLDLNFDGPFGIDAFIYKDKQSPYGFRIKFISEINPRFTMGRVALEISKRIIPNISSLWLHLRIKDIEEKFKTKLIFEYKIKEEFPLEIISTSKPQIKSGVLFTNDFEQAIQVITLLIVGKEAIEKFKHFYYNPPLAF